jgi:hypothetical protein
MLGRIESHFGFGSASAGRNPCRQRLSLSGKQPFEREIGFSRAERPETARKRAVARARLSGGL